MNRDFRKDDGVRKVAVIGALDTKGPEFEYLKEQIEKYDLETLVIDTGILGQPGFEPDISSDEVLLEINKTRKDLIEAGRSKANTWMMEAIKSFILKLFDQNKICGAISMGGGQGTHVGAAAMSVLPLGFPKVLLSTVATVEHAQNHFVGVNDTMIMNTLVDVQGLNFILKNILQSAAAVMAGWVRCKREETYNKKKRVAVTMFGITTPCVSRLQKKLKEKDIEVIVFHSTGMGGRIFEKMIRDGLIDAAADITLGEITAQEFHFEGSAGPERMTAAAQMGIPQVVVPGAMDVMTFFSENNIPEHLKTGRKSIRHNQDVLVFRTDEIENRKLGKAIAQKINDCIGPILVMLPLGGVSDNDMPGKPFWYPAADEALFCALKENLRPDIPVLEKTCHINDPEFADAIAEWLICSLGKAKNCEG